MEKNKVKPTKKVVQPTKKVAQHTKKVAQPTKKEAQPTKKEAQPTKKEAQPTKKEVQSSKKQVQSKKKEVQPKNKETKLERSDSISSSDSTQDEDVQINMPGGIDLNIPQDELIKNSSNLKFQGLLITKKLLIFNPKAKTTKNTSKLKSTLNLEDVCVFLKILYDPNIKCKRISFSLDPYEPTNPKGPYLRKVYWPDEMEKRKILGGTKIGEDMFQADYIMKQLSLGIMPDNKTLFNYPPSLKVLAPISLAKIENKSSHSTEKWSRMWIILKQIDTYSKKQSLFCLKNIHMGIEARQMIIGKNGKLEDKVSQDKNDNCYIFANKLTELYEPTSLVYKSFQRIKEITGALAVAKWLYENQIPIDLDLITKIYEKTLINNFNNKIPAINFTKEIEINEKTKIDVREQAKRQLEMKKIPITEKAIQMEVDALNKAFPGREYYLIKKGKVKRIVFGGVDFFTNLLAKDTEKNHLNDSFSSVSTQGEEEEEKIITVSNNKKVNVDLTKCEVKEFPILKNKECSICKKKLSLDSMRTCQILQTVLNNKEYCNEHNPFKCVACNKLALQGVFKFRDSVYHKNCIRCNVCKKSFDSNAVEREGKFYHKKCIDSLKV